MFTIEISYVGDEGRSRVFHVVSDTLYEAEQYAIRVIEAKTEQDGVRLVYLYDFTYIAVHEGIAVASVEVCDYDLFGRIQGVFIRKQRR